jgi:hypothetical protein
VYVPTESWVGPRAGRKVLKTKFFCLYRDSSPRPHSPQLSRYTDYDASALQSHGTLEIKAHMLSSRIRVIAVADTARKLLEHCDG